MTRRWALFAGVALILVTNAVVLAGVAWNRSGQRESELRLSERELSAPISSWRSSENSGMALDIAWRVVPARVEGRDEMRAFVYGAYASPGFLDEAKLGTLGFDVAAIKRRDGGGNRKRTALAREVVLVLEFDGPATRAQLDLATRLAAAADEALRINPSDATLQNKARQAAEWLKSERGVNTRLVIVDAGLDREALRARYPDRSHYAFLRGHIRPEVASSRVTGVIDGLDVAAINVPVELRGVFENVRRAQVAPVIAGSSYDATVAIGRRLEPWLVAASRR